MRLGAGSRSGEVSIFSSRSWESNVRWKLGILSLVVAMPFWAGSFLAVPYTSWGVEDEQVRPAWPA
jgi:hypothetical protein